MAWAAGMDGPHLLYTIGHSNAELPAFLALLRQCEIALLADVRSRPRSFRFPQFSLPDLEASLRENGLGYLFLGEELGGRPEDPRMYLEDGRVNYRARRKARDFQSGIERIVAEREQRSLALMCAEEDPLHCHRFLMICPELVARGLEPRHIRRGGAIELQRAAEDRLLEAHHFGDVASGALFAVDRACALEDAYDLQAREVAFRADPLTIEFG